MRYLLLLFEKLFFCDALIPLTATNRNKENKRQYEYN